MPSYTTLLYDGEFVCHREDGEIYQLGGEFYLVQEEWNGLEVGHVVYFLENVSC